MRIKIAISLMLFSMTASAFKPMDSSRLESYDSNMYVHLISLGTGIYSEGSKKAKSICRMDYDESGYSSWLIVSSEVKKIFKYNANESKYARNAEFVKVKAIHGKCEGTTGWTLLDRIGGMSDYSTDYDIRRFKAAYEIGFENTLEDLRATNNLVGAINLYGLLEDEKFKRPLDDLIGILSAQIRKEYESAKSCTKITCFSKFYSEWMSNSNAYQNAVSKKEIQNLADEAYQLAEAKASIGAFVEFYDSFPEKNDKALRKIYELTSEQDNISGYSWFIKKFPRSVYAKKSLERLHQIAYDVALGVDTIGSYNDFIIAYPYAKQVKDALVRSYELEEKEYTGFASFFSGDEKEARRLLVQSKILEQNAENISYDNKVGYMLVVNRMNDLLKKEFDSTDAALRHLESNEFKSFVKQFNSAMKDLNKELSLIADNTSDMSRIMRKQTDMMNGYFEKSAQDRDMQAELSRQHRQWERYIGVVGK